MAEEGEIWSRLPLEIMENICSRLSVYDIVRVGCTCTRLRAFISSHKLISSSSVSLLLLDYPFDVPYVQEDCPVWAYDGTRDAWLEVSLAFLLPHMPISPHPVASAGGLLCFGAGCEFLVCNPITRSFRRLPNHPLLIDMESTFDEDTMQAFGLTYDPITGTYEFFIVHHSIMQAEENSRMVHYSSFPSQWRAMPPLIMSKECELHSNDITFCGGKLYTLWVKGETLVVYANCNGIWTEIESPERISSWSKAALLDAHGCLHMVGGVGSAWLHDNVWERPTSVRVWKLHGESMEWMEVARMPSLVLQEFRRLIDFDDLQWWGKNGVLFMKSLRSDILMYDLSRDEWKWFKTSEPDADLGGLLFEPSLSASA